MYMENIEKYIDHTLLKADAKDDDIIKLCCEAKEYGFKAVCVNPCFVPLAAKELKDSGVLVCTVIGFPLGANDIKTKVFEAVNAVSSGAKEVDMVINIGKLKANDYEYIEKEIRSVVMAVCGKAKIKVIIETCMLTEEEKKTACELVIKAGADFIKTSTGFSFAGAAKEDVLLLNNTAQGRIKIKASGGIRDLKTAEVMINAGADRIGTSSGIAIVKEANKK